MRQKEFEYDWDRSPSRKEALELAWNKFEGELGKRDSSRKA